ncbi:methyltransferase domain-containing protein [Arenicella sp. 4NH20-0111]
MGPEIHVPLTNGITVNRIILSGINSKQLSSSGTWASTHYGRSFFELERSRLESGMRQAIGPSTLQLGSMLDETVVSDLDLPYVLKVQMGPLPSAHSIAEANLAADPAFLPFVPSSFSTVLLPHVLEAHSLPHQVLREVHRVLQAEGYVVITGFNPSSLLGLQRWLRPKSASAGRYYTPGRVIDWLHVLGFDVVASSNFQYAPLTSRPKVRKLVSFFESVGDRWLPMFGGGYMITAKKKESAGTMIGKVRFRKPRPKLVAPATAKSTNQRNSEK